MQLYFSLCGLSSTCRKSLWTLSGLFWKPKKKRHHFPQTHFQVLCHLARCKGTSGPEGLTTSPSYSIHVSILESRGLLPVADFSSQSCKPCTGVLTSHAGMWNSSHAMNKKVRPNSWPNPLKRELVLAHRYRGFNPWLLGLMHLEEHRGSWSKCQRSFLTSW